VTSPEKKRVETYMSRKIRQIEEENYKNFGNNGLCWKPKVSKLEEEV